MVVLRVMILFWQCSTSHLLLDRLRKDGFHATGTIREARIISSPLIDSKSMDKQPRGTYDWSFDEDAEVIVVKWKDNSNVCLASNFEHVHPTTTVKRYCRRAKEAISVQQPKLISSYNKSMGGVDIHDNFVSKYRIHVKGKKWWWPLFTNLIDSSLVNAWRLHRIIKSNGCDLLNFRRQVAVALLKTPKSSNSISKEPEARRLGPPSNVTVIQRHQDVNSNHTIVKSSRRLRCRQCKSQTIFICSTCRVGVHAKCFELFHSWSCDFDEIFYQ